MDVDIRNGGEYVARKEDGSGSYGWREVMGLDLTELGGWIVVDDDDRDVRMNVLCSVVFVTKRIE